MDPRGLPEEKVIKTLMVLNLVGTRQRERGLQQTARLSAEEYPQVNQIAQNYIHVDDYLSGEENVEKAFKKVD